MKYFKTTNESRVIAIFRTVNAPANSEEITEAEYNTLLAEIRTKAEVVDKLYGGEITLADVPAEWREEIQRRVNERIAAEAEAAEEEISGEELLSMMEGIV